MYTHKPVIFSKVGTNHPPTKTLRHPALEVIMSLHQPVAPTMGWSILPCKNVVYLTKVVSNIQPA